MATFSEFRNSFPESRNEKGERFEIFLSEWMFKHHPVLSSQFKEVWRFTDWPKAWSGKDIGTDLIAEDYNGKICAIQAKCYKEESSIPKGHVDSFLSDSARSIIDYRYLIATTDRIGLSATVTIEGQEKPVHMFLLSDFLDPFNWPESLASLDEYKPRKPHQRKPHQLKAIDDVTKKLEDRGQLIMACGTGKTLAGQRIAEKLKCKTTLVLLPSLILLSKTVKEWVNEREEDFIFLPVCSDKNVTTGDDEIALSNSELPMRSTTNAAEIVEFLRRKRNKVVFATYQSSPKVAEAFRLGTVSPLDLILADEAHRCAGKISPEFSTVLDNKKIPAKRRLFMTATPRMYSSSLKNKVNEVDIQIASMDDEVVFGPVLHHLTFGQAIAHDPPLLTDYRVVVVGVNEASYRSLVEERALLKTKGGVEDDARSLATLLGLSKAIKNYDLKRVISFHNRVTLARDFADSFMKFQQDLKAEAKPEGKITYRHVSGEMPTSERVRKLRALGSLTDEDRYLLANARCLSEGVDVPALDGVAFIDPKRSKIDIIQAVGRAIRLSAGKETGTIVIPVFLSDSEDPDEVLSTSEFDQVWEVVNALRSHEETLGDMLDEFRTKLARKQKVSFKGSKLIIDLPATMPPHFIDAFETKLIETTTASWDFLYGLLIEYQKEFGNCLVHNGYRINGFRLGSWVSNQRHLKNSLPRDRLEKLNALAFVWDAFEQAWDEAFQYLCNYKKLNGDCLVPQREVFEGFALGTWVGTQRKLGGDISAERLEKLNSIGFSWNPIEESWDKGLEHLAQYHAEKGDCLVPRDYVSKNFPLGHWVSRQRKSRTSLTKEKVAKLNGLQFVWNTRKDAWEQGFSRLENYKMQNGNCIVKKGYVIDGFNLGSWVVRQRNQRGELTTEQFNRLDSIGFNWEVHKDAWQTGYSYLAAYKALHGDCLVPNRHKIDGFNLGTWVANQRSDKQTMSKKRFEKLNGIGFVWDVMDYKWQRGLYQLKSYKAAYGDCLVPQRYQVNGIALGTWVFRLRASKEELSRDQLDTLNSLGFVWDLKQDAWNKAISCLRAYKESNGHCRVPNGYKAQGFSLGQWVSKQRRLGNSISSERRLELEALGFEWDFQKRNV